MIKFTTFLVILFAAGKTKIDCKNIGDVASNTWTVGTNLPTNKGNEGETRESCRMQCNWDGSCTETVETWTWKCNGIPKTKISSTFFKVGNILGYRRATGGDYVAIVKKILCLGLLILQLL
jgi:hypothetical protein